jgi:predicted DNA-binding antitoxin AbrB/MazE fold protein
MRWMVSTLNFFCQLARMSRIPTFAATRFPKKMPNNYILSMVAHQPPASDFAPLKTEAGTLKPKISYAKQLRIKSCADLIGVDTVFKLSQPELTVKLPKGSKTLLEKADRQKRVSENMKRMDKRIEEYRKERRKAKEAKKPDMPF